MTGHGAQNRQLGLIAMTSALEMYRGTSTVHELSRRPGGTSTMPPPRHLASKAVRRCATGYIERQLEGQTRCTEDGFPSRSSRTQPRRRQKASRRPSSEVCSQHGKWAHKCRRQTCKWAIGGGWPAELTPQQSLTVPQMCIKSQATNSTRGETVLQHLSTAGRRPRACYLNQHTTAQILVGELENWRRRRRG